MVYALINIQQFDQQFLITYILNFSMTILKNMFELKREMEERKIKENKATYNIILNPLQLGASRKKNNLYCIIFGKENRK